MLSTWNHKIIGIALKANGENLKAKFVIRLLYHGFGIIDAYKSGELSKLSMREWVIYVVNI